MNRVHSFMLGMLSLLSFVGCTSYGTQRTSLGIRTLQNIAVNPGVVEINHPSNYSQIVVISDVHGMYNPLVTLLKAGKIIDNKNQWIAGNSLLIVTGDSIDKGPQSLEVLNLWISIQSQALSSGGGLVHALGNHEAEFLSDPQNAKKAAELIAEMKAQNVPLSDLTSTQTPRGLFLHNEPVAVRVGRWLFCHSGFYPNMSWADFSSQAQKVLVAQNYGSDFLIGNSSILEAKDWEKNSSMLTPMITRMNTAGLFGIVFGHQPKAFGVQGRSASKMGGRLIKIDSGMAPEAGSHPGSLLVFTTPAQMNQMAYPQIKVIFSDGTHKDLKPE